MNLDKAQQTAVHHRDGPAMVLAGPGSGKTTVLTERLRFLIVKEHIDPSSILVITFSRAAAREMQERFLLRMDRQYLPVTFGTFHAVFFHILQNAYGYTSEQIVRENVKRRFFREYVRRLRLENVEEEDLVSGLISAISRQKNSGTDAGNLNLPCEKEVFFTIWEAYREFLRQNGWLDFDDMLLLTRDLFLTRPDILEAWQKRFRHILIDEFQDINRIQYEVIRMLAQPENNLFIVGDDDQSIYGFRGANPRLMLRYPEEYPNAARVLLETNYRSEASIVRAAGALITHNTQRFKKEIRAHTASDNAPVLRVFPSQFAQNLFVIEEARRLQRQVGVPFSEMAILFRTNDEVRLLSQQLLSFNLPLLSREHLPLLCDHWISQDINAYLRLASGERTRANFLRVLNRPNRELSRESLPYEEVEFPVWEQYYRNPIREENSWHPTDSRRAEAKIEEIKKLERDLSQLANLRPYSALTYIRKAIGYDEYLRKHAAAHHMSLEDLFDLADELMENAKGFDTIEEWLAAQEEVRRAWEQTFGKNRFPSGGSRQEAITLSTYHAAKGLEYDTVFLIDLCENVIPYKRAILSEDLEEERRLFYVGMTRAKRRLYLLSPAQIRNKEMAPSRFLAESAVLHLLQQ